MASDIARMVGTYNRQTNGESNSHPETNRLYFSDIARMTGTYNRQTNRERNPPPRDKMVKPEAVFQHMFQQTIGLHSSLLEVRTEVVEKRLWLATF